VNASPFQIACDELAELGLKLTQARGECRVNFHDGSPATEYATDDLADALKHGRKMAQRPPPPALPPLGPVGGRTTRRGQMLKHNRKIAAKRRRAAAKGGRQKP
jgi:hypothetical protein